METKTKTKATRRIKKFDFSDENSTVSLVGPMVGGAANGYSTLLTKSNKQVSEEFLRKASEITVTMEITEYLGKFYNIWYTDAEVLARALGFVTAEMEREDTSEEYEDYYEKMISERVASIKVMKQLNEAENIEDALLSISEDDYLQFLQDQEIVEKALLSVSSDSTAKTAEKETSTDASVENLGGVSAPVVKQKKKGNGNMTKEVQTIEQKVEVIAKAEFDTVQKALDEQKVELQKALDLVQELQKEKKEAIAKSRKEKLQKAVGDKFEVIFKACGGADEELFNQVVEVFVEMQSKIEKSELFKEVGIEGDNEVQEENPVAKLIKQKYSK